jgi:DNA polymerase-1
MDKSPSGSLLALWDSETNGLLRHRDPAKVASKVHCIGFKIGADWWACMDDFSVVPIGIRPGVVTDITLPNGNVLKGVRIATIQEGLRELEKADVRVAHNGQDFDERIVRKFYPWWEPQGESVILDTLLLSRLVYPSIFKDGPNTHKLPGQLKVRHSVEAWGYRLGEKKDKGFDAGDWQTFSWDMLLYMMQDVVVLERIFKWLMHQKPNPAAVRNEHDFAAIIRRQEAWGFTFDYPNALKLQADLQTKIAALEADLVDTFGEWWQPGKTTRVKATRRVKLPEYPDVTIPRVSKAGKPLKPYVGPPVCIFEEGATFTPIERVEFNPGSRDHVRLMLGQRYGWKPKKFTDKGTPQIDDDVLRALDYPEAPKLADYYAAKKISGYVTEGKKAWLMVAHEEADAHRMHGSVNTIGTYTFRCSHMDPNCGQIPSRDPEYGHRCRELYMARPGFRLVGFDGSGMQLRGLAHYLHQWDGGAYVKVFEDGIDPHGFMRDTIGLDLMGEGEAGRKNGKTMNYALTFGGGDKKLGSIVRPHAKESMQADIGREVKRRMLPVFGTAFDDLKGALRERVEARGNLVGLDGRIARVAKPHAALATLLQMFEAVVMKKALILMDQSLQANGLRPGVDGAGLVHPELADYEFCANVHDEAQADVRPQHVDLYTRLALECVPEAGRQLRVKCPLKSDVKVGSTWADTH